MSDKKIRELFNVEAERKAYMADKKISGRPLLEVFKVTINNIDDENPGNLYGEIIATAGGKSQHLYNRGKGNSEEVRPGGFATLTGPAEECISPSDGFIIDVDLMDRDKPPDPTPDDQVSKGQISWRSHNSSIQYDVLLSETISGDKGNATIFYAVFSDAVQARVEVKLINADNEKSAEVYGKLTVAYKGKPGLEEIKDHVLLLRDADSYIDVRPQELIPLDRSLVAVPLDCELQVYADLWEHDPFPDPTPDEEIAKGFVTFPAQLSGTSEKKLFGSDGSVEVKVTWTA